MLRRAMTWVTCFAVGFLTLAVENDAEAGRRRAWRRGAGACCGVGYAYGGTGYAYGGWSGGQNQGACCTTGVAYQQPMMNACVVQPAGYQSPATYEHSTGYAPRGTWQQGQGQGTWQQGSQQGNQYGNPPASRAVAPAPAPIESLPSDNAPRTFQEAPEPDTNRQNPNREELNREELNRERLDQNTDDQNN
jgi:hypothetical protein